MFESSDDFEYELVGVLIDGMPGALTPGLLVGSGSANNRVTPGLRGTSSFQPMLAADCGLTNLGATAGSVVNRCWSINERIRGVAPHKDVVGTYFEGFRQSNHQKILACLTDDVTWDLPGYRHLGGKDEFDQEIENEEFVGSPTLTIDRVIEEGDVVVAIGTGETTHRSGDVRRFAFCDVFTFTGDRIGRVESYLVPLP